MERQCPECGGRLTPTSAATEMTSTSSTYLCPECQLEFRHDAANGLREVDD